MERILKALLIIMLMVLFMQKVVQPTIEEAKATKTSLANVRAALQHMASSDSARTADFLRTEKKMIAAYLQEMDKILPDYQTTRVGAIGNLEMLREKFYGKWEIQPSPQPIIDESMVRWPVKLVFASDFQSALRVLNSIDKELAMNRILTIDFNTGKTTEVELTVNLELLFRNVPSASSQLALTATEAGGTI